MARLTDPDILARYKQALSEWKVVGYIELKKDAYEGLRTTLGGLPEKEFKEALCRFVCEENGEVTSKLTVAAALAAMPSLAVYENESAPK